MTTRKRTGKTTTSTSTTVARTAAKKTAARKRTSSTAKKRTTKAKAAAEGEPLAAEPGALREALEPLAVAAEVVPPSPETAAEVAAAGGRRGIFFDVENTSRSEDIGRVLEHLQIDWTRQAVTFTAVGNWRVIGHETARLLAQRGASLVHSAPSVGVRDWSDLRIAVGAGVWLAGARPGDVIEIVSDDQAFDAVGDVAASLGVTFRRLSYRALAGVTRSAAPAVEAPKSQRGSRRRRGGRRPSRGGRRSDEVAAAPASGARTVAIAEPRRAPAPQSSGADEVPAPEDEIVGLVRQLLVASPKGISLDTLANELRERGFRRPPGSYRLITRLKHIKELQIAGGNITLVGSASAPGADREAEARAEAGVALEPPAEAWPEAELSGGEEPGGSGEAGDDEPAAENGTGNGGTGRRRRRRGGRRRRGRRNGNGESVTAPNPGMAPIGEPGDLAPEPY